MSIFFADRDCVHGETSVWDGLLKNESIADPQGFLTRAPIPCKECWHRQSKSALRDRVTKREIKKRLIR